MESNNVSIAKEHRTLPGTERNLLKVAYLQIAYSKLFYFFLSKETEKDKSCSGRQSEVGSTFGEIPGLSLSLTDNVSKLMNLIHTNSCHYRVVSLFI